jgi:hypothetical protein
MSGFETSVHSLNIMKHLKTEHIIDSNRWQWYPNGNIKTISQIWTISDTQLFNMTIVQFIRRSLSKLSWPNIILGKKVVIIYIHFLIVKLYIKGNKNLSLDIIVNSFAEVLNDWTRNCSSIPWWLSNSTIIYTIFKIFLTSLMIDRFKIILM